MIPALKIISGLLAFVMLRSPAFGFGGNNKAENNKADGKTVTVTVARDGSGDYATLEEARDYVRTIDKSKYGGIDIVVKDGMYQAEKTFALTAEDSGTENCPVRYIGEDGAHLYGGVSFTAADFEPLGDSEVVQYFPEDVKDKLVRIDLKQFGFTDLSADDIRKMVWAGGSQTVPLYCNGEKQDVARFPNAETGTVDDWARIISGSKEGYVATIEFDEAYNERVHSWHDVTDVLVDGHFTYMWARDNESLITIDPEKPIMQVAAYGYQPRENMIFYWYYVPEELDFPGEYYIDKDCILYYYPTEDHETATYTMPVLDGNMISLEGAEYITIEGLFLETTRRSGIDGYGNNITIQNCTVQGVIGNGISLYGVNITVQNNTVKSIGGNAIVVDGGDKATLTRANNLIYNNYVEDWSNIKGCFRWAIQSFGCGITVSHNEICHSVDWGIEVNGADILVEYNHVYDVSRFQDDQAAIHVSGYDMITRYNYVHDCGFVDRYTDIMGISGIDSDYHLGRVETYGNIVSNVTGYGHLITNADNANIHDNLYISCRKGAVCYTDQNYTNILRGVSSGTCADIEDYLSTDLWTERFPFLKDIILTLTEDEVNALGDTPVAEINPNYWFVPDGSSVRNNFVYIDKANLADPSKGLSQPYLYYDLCKEFADIAEPTDDEVIVFSSKRTAYPTIKEALERAAGTINLPYEEFEKIGRIK